MAYLVAMQASSWFDNNKKWLIPTVIGLLVFMIVAYIVSSVVGSQSTASEAFTNVKRVKSQIDDDKERFENINSQNIYNR